jgi:hypothetical protein
MALSAPPSIPALAVLSVAILVGLPAPAQDPHYDVFVTSDGSGLILGGYDDEATTAVIPAEQMRVFGGEAVPVTGSSAPYTSTSPGEPGFRAATQAFLDNGALTTPAGVYTALPGATPLTFSFLPMEIESATRNLFYWAGTGTTVAFVPAASDVSVNLQKQGGGGWTAGITGNSASVIAGNTIQTTSSGGSVGTVHTHLFTSIDKAGAAPDMGFYLFSLEMQMSGLQSSAASYFVYGALDPDALTPQELADFEIAHGLAEAWVETNLAAVPEPASLTLVSAVGLAGGLASLRRWARGRTRRERCPEAAPSLVG